MTEATLTKPDVSGSDVRTKVAAWMLWEDPENAPKFKRIPSQHLAAWHSVRASVQLLEDGTMPRNNVRVTLSGHYYKVDGSLGKATATQRYYGLDELPHEGLRDAIWAKLNAELAEWEAAR